MLFRGYHAQTTQRGGINDGQCPSSADAFDITANTNVMVWRDHQATAAGAGANGMDGELCLEVEEARLHDPRTRRFPFMTAYAQYHSALVKDLSATYSIVEGSTAKNCRVFAIPKVSFTP